MSILEAIDRAPDVFWVVGAVVLVLLGRPE